MTQLFSIRNKTYLLPLMSLLLACGEYYVETPGLIVTTEPVVVETYPFYGERLTFEVTWSQSDGWDELYVSLRTPFGGYVADGSLEIDGCYFLGTYEASFQDRVSTIECLDSPFGPYDVYIDNLGYVVRNPIIDVTLERLQGAFVDVTTTSEITTVFPYETLIYSYFL